MSEEIKLDDVLPDSTTPAPKRNYHLSAKQRLYRAEARALKNTKLEQKALNKAVVKASANRQRIKDKEVKLSNLKAQINGIAKNYLVDGEALKETVAGKNALKQDEVNYIFRPNPGQQERFLASSEREVGYGGAAGGGKAQPVYARVLTLSGWRRIGDLKIGDSVLTPRNETATILQVHPQGVQHIYKVTFQDGSVAECTADHLWYSKPKRDSSDRFRARPLCELLLSPQQFVVPLTDAVNLPVVDVSIDPYVLGCILGDGCITTNSVGFTSADEFVISELAKYVVVTKRKAKYQYGINGIVSKLRELDLLGKNSHTKFIPREYKIGSVEQRYSIIQGLMDTDGYVSIDGKVNYTSMSSQMLDDVAYLIRSLGGTAKKLKGHTLYIRHPDSSKLFRLPKKVERCHKKTINNRIVSIEASHQEEAVCITLDSDLQLYITDNFIVTHNSYAMLADAIRYAGNKNMRALLLRRNMPELLELIDKSRQLYPLVFTGSVFKEKDHRWVFPSGATLQFSFVENDADVYRYQGQSFTWIGIDEITHYPTPFVWNYLRSRLRSTDPTIPLYMRCTCNPGGVGGWWVKKMFIDPAPMGETFWATDIETETVLTFPFIDSVPKELQGKPLFKRKFIPARLTDNPHLMRSMDYLAGLASLPEVHRRRLLEGDWDVAEDTAFPEFNRKIHICEPFKIPSGWHRFRACDYGFVDPAAVLWFALSHDGTFYIYRELYQKGLDGDALADKIIEMEWDDPGALTGPLDPETWSARGQMGLSPAEAMIKKGVRWIKADKGPGSRVRGKQEIHRKLRVNPNTGKPGVVIFSTCRILQRVFPVLPLDETNREDVDADYVDDHIYDALRYGLVTRQRYSLYPEERALMEQAERPKIFDEIFGH